MITRILIGINVIVFVLMGLSGVSIIEPSIQALIRWGASSPEHIIDGEWWRLLTSTVIHIGIIHLLMNMYVLYSVGTFLEPFLGKALFFIAYIAAGILSGLVSFLVHKETLIISAGASGAIAGIYGLYVFILLTPLIPSEIRNKLLKSALSMLGVNVFYGLTRGGIDHAAHLGGLFSGFIIGALFYPLLSYHRWIGRFRIAISFSHLKKLSLAGVVMLALILVPVTLSGQKPSSHLKFAKYMQEFSQIEEEIFKQMGKIRPFDSNETVVFLMKANVLPRIEKIKQIVFEMDQLELKPEEQRVKDYIDRYVNLLGQRSHLVMLCYRDNNPIYEMTIKKLDGEIEALNKKFESEYKDL